jgi:hypothetical protein
LRPLCEAVEMYDAIARYQAASVANDIEAVIATLVRAAELVSPMSGHMVFLGQADLQVPFDAIYGFPRDLRWPEEIRDGSVRVVVGEAHIGPVRLTDRGSSIDLGGKTECIRPHQRPSVAPTLLALRLLSRVGRHPGVLRRALGAG